MLRDICRNPLHSEYAPSGLYSQPYEARVPALYARRIGTDRSIDPAWTNTWAPVTVAAILLLSVLQIWTNLETHWLHTLLFVACVVYNCSRTRGRRRLAVLANTRSDQEQRPPGRGRM